MSAPALRVLIDTPEQQAALVDALARCNRQRVSSHIDGIWEEGVFNEEPFMAIRASDYDILTQPRDSEAERLLRQAREEMECAMNSADPHGYIRPILARIDAHLTNQAGETT